MELEVDAAKTSKGGSPGRGSRQVCGFGGGIADDVFPRDNGIAIAVKREVDHGQADFGKGRETGRVERAAQGKHPIDIFIERMGIAEPLDGLDKARAEGIYAAEGQQHQVVLRLPLYPGPAAAAFLGAVRAGAGDIGKDYIAGDD